MKAGARVLPLNSVLNAHDQFLETCLRECHLSNKAIFKLIHKLMAKVTIYVNFMNGVHRQVTVSVRATKI